MADRTTASPPRPHGASTTYLPAIVSPRLGIVHFSSGAWPVILVRSSGAPVSARCNRAVGVRKPGHVVALSPRGVRYKVDRPMRALCVAMLTLTTAAACAASAPTNIAGPAISPGTPAPPSIVLARDGGEDTMDASAAVAPPPRDPPFALHAERSSQRAAPNPAPAGTAPPGRAR